jgi:hypothetical protein
MSPPFCNIDLDYLYHLILVMSIKAKTNSLLAHLLALVLFPKNLNNWSTTKPGCSSGIQCPESGTVMPFTFAANVSPSFKKE